jgi:fructose-1,6-bisphosphatase/inositol monophosphatase family enzyme
LIGVEVADEPVAGVVNLPALGEMVYAARGSGCYVNDVRAQVSATNTLNEALLLCTDFGPCDRGALVDLQRRVRVRRTWGDVYGYVLVASGRADVMLDPVVKIWDCAPLLPILEEAGGTFTDWQGNRTINGGNAVATNGRLFDDVIQVLREPAVSEMKRRAIH